MHLYIILLFNKKYKTHALYINLILHLIDLQIDMGEWFFLYIYEPVYILPYFFHLIVEK